MNTESELLAEVEALKAKFSETRALYREVCALLFFRHGITPTANKLYQYVRRGSMNVPTEEVGKFWDDLRHRARIDIEHPDLPESIKAVAAEAIAALWSHATEAARGELAAARLEMQAEAEQCRAGRDAAEQAVVRMHAAAEHLRADMERMEAETKAMRHELEAERRGHTGTQARVAQMQNQLDEGRRQQQALQDGFAAELGKARVTVEAANERAAGAERRALKEIEQERQARARADKVVDELRDKLAGAEGRERQNSLANAEASTRLQMELNTAKSALERSLESREELDSALAQLRKRLAVAEDLATRYQVEAQTLQGLVQRLTPLPATEIKPAPVRAGRRKPGSSGT